MNIKNRMFGKQMAKIYHSFVTLMMVTTLQNILCTIQYICTNISANSLRKKFLPQYTVSWKILSYTIECLHCLKKLGLTAT